MAVSYVSEIIRANPWVQPFDLNLMTRVNQYKQGVFYQNANNLENMLGQLENTDIFKDEERQYLKGKVNNLVQQINNVGAIDYSDMNIVNTIEGFGSDIYNDPTITTAINSTKKVREYLKNAETLKNDPKLNKYYSEARFWYDTQYEGNPNSILNYKNSRFGESYNGPTAPTPYLGSDWDILTKEINKINPDITTRTDSFGNKYFYNTKENKVVTRERVMSLVDGRIDAKVAEQLKVSAIYNYHGLTNGTFTKEQGVSQFVDFNQNSLDKAKGVLAQYERAFTTTADPVEREKIQSEIDYYKNEVIPAYEKAVTIGKDEFSKIWDKDRNAAYYALYTTKLKNDIGDVYSYSQEKERLTVNQEKLMDMRMQLEAMKNNATVQRNSDGTVTFVPNASITDQPITNFSNLENANETTAELRTQETTIENLDAEQDKIRNEIDLSLRNLLKTDANVNNIPGLSEGDLQFTNVGGAQPTMRANKIDELARLTGSARLEKEDLEYLVANAKDGVVYKKNANGETVPVVNFTPEQVQYFQNKLKFWNDWADDKLDNQDDAISKTKMKDEWGKFIFDYTLSRSRIDVIDNLKTQAYNQVVGDKFKDKGLTNAESVILRDFVINPSKYVIETPRTVISSSPTTGVSFETTITERTFIGSPEEKAALQKAGFFDNSGNFKDLNITTNVNKEVNKLLITLGNRKNYYNVVLPDDTKTLNEKFSGIVNRIMQDPDFPIKKVSDVNPVALVTDANGTYYIKYNDASKANSGFYYAEISQEEALRAFKLQPIPYPYLEQAVSDNGKLNTPLLYRSKNTSIQKPIRINIFKEGDPRDRNSATYRAAVIYNNKTYYYFPEKVINNQYADAQKKLANNALQGLIGVIDNFKGDFNSLLTWLDSTTN